MSLKTLIATMVAVARWKLGFRSMRDIVQKLVRESKVPRLRTMQEFAEQEIIIPNGDFKDLLFNVSRQPFTRWWFQLIDAAAAGLTPFNRFVATGPTQTGKTLACFVIPILYHLFEIGEDVVVGVPDMGMAADKWREDILPVLEYSRFRDLIPKHGAGSRGGKVDTIQFANGATLKFMSAAGSDKARAGFTARVLVITETDGMDESSTTSDEADKITQLEGRTRHYGDRKCVYMECTVSIDTGRTWTEYTNGTTTRLVMPCPHCKEYVHLDRESLQGWQGAEDELAARANTQWFCPQCGESWTDKERKEAAGQCVALHRGQSITPEGEITGDLPRTMTLGFRWTAADNMFTTAAQLGAEEWGASRATDEENAERKMRQFVWALPFIPPEWVQTPLLAHEIERRTISLGKGFVPENTEFVTVGLDPAKMRCHWIAVAWTVDGSPHIFDYGVFTLLADQLGVEQGIYSGVSEFRDEVAELGWQTPGGVTWTPDAVWLDGGYMTQVACNIVRKSPPHWLPVMGLGTGQLTSGSYRPRKGKDVRYSSGNGYYIEWRPVDGVHMAMLDADHWKTFVHERLTTPVGMPGSCTLYAGAHGDHRELARHFTAERAVEIFDPKRGKILTWESIRRQNHWLDTFSYACAAAHCVGVRILPQGSAALAEPAPAEKRATFTTPGGLPYMVTDRG